MDPSYYPTIAPVRAVCGEARRVLERPVFVALVLGLSMTSCKRKVSSQTQVSGRAEVIEPKPMDIKKPSRELTVSTVPDLKAFKTHLRQRLDKIETYEALDPGLALSYSQGLHAVLFEEKIPKGVFMPSEHRFERVEVQGLNQSFMVYSEGGAHRNGLPQIVWRAPSRKGRGGWILQAPHRFFDRHTGELALALFANTDPRNARILFLNAKHRYAQEDGEKKKRAHNPSDVCHNASHGFQRVTSNTMVSMSSNDIVQLHGFDAKDRQSALVIISSGDANQASPRARALVEALRTRFGGKVLLFPRDTSQLGATTNVQGRLLKGYAARDPQRSANGFLHIELSREFREQLLSDSKTLEHFSSALFGVMSPDSQGRR